MGDSSYLGMLTIKAGPDTGKAIKLSDSDLIIGRVPPAGLVIGHAEVSRQHARIFYRDGTFYIEDLGSSNGTVVGGKPVTTAVPLKSGDVIALGSEVRMGFRVTDDSAAKTEVYPAAAETADDMAADAEPTVAEKLAGQEAAMERSADMAGEPTRAEAPAAAAASGEPPVEMPRAAETMLEMDVEKLIGQARVAEVPPILAVTIAGQQAREYTLTKPNVSIGRAEDNDIVVPSQIVSRHHANLQKTANGYEIVIGDRVTNTLSVQGRPVTDRRLLAHGDVLRIDSDLPGLMVSMTYAAPSEAAAAGGALQVQFGEKEKLTFGRDATNDVVLDVPVVSRFHAQITRVGRRYLIQDLRSVNGTFVNDQRVQGDIWLNPQDTVRIGPYRFVLGENQLTRYDETEGLRVEAYHLNKWVRKDLNLLQDISLIFQPKEFIVVVGQSGGGKSTLVDSIAGYRPATGGKVFVNGIDVYRNFDAVRNQLGFVPQKDIIHMELTVHQALDYAAKLRMPKDTSAAERHKRIAEVLDELDLAHRKDIQVSGLSGGQQKRVSIGVELLTRPGLFFLDEPTSGLDPGTETAFMHLNRRLADQGRTIIMVTHATKNVMLADKVVFLARGGHLAWFGPPDEALAYFDQYRSEAERRAKPMEFDQIYAVLDDPSKGKASDWAQRFASYDAFRKYIVEPLQAGTAQLQTAQAAPTKKGTSKRPRVSSLRQFMVLSARNVTILSRDRIGLILMLAAAPVIGSLDLLLGIIMGRRVFSYESGAVDKAGVSLFLVVMYSLLAGAMSQMREFVKEADIYKRERLVNLRIFPYVTSKVWLAVVLAFYQALCYTVLHYIAFSMPGGAPAMLEFYITVALAVLTGMMLGLLVSALAPSQSTAPMIIVMCMVPLIVLAGAMVRVPSQVSQFASTRWALQGLFGISGAGSDVVADACWALDPQLRDRMTIDDKAAAGCRCMGVGMFDPDTCNYPGLDLIAKKVPELHQEAPTPPPGLGPRPTEPPLGDAPTPPADTTDPLQITQYTQALIAFQQTAQTTFDDFRNQLQLYQASADVYAGQSRVYAEELFNYLGRRQFAAAAGEFAIQRGKDQFDWAWVDKDNPSLYRAWLMNTWLHQIAICLVYFGLILFFIKRKDVK
jgi:ABC transport system ATP-binding/permease protein